MAFNKSKLFRIHPETDGDKIVLSGMSGKFPNCKNVSELRENLFAKIDMVDDEERRWRHFSSEIPKRCGKIYDVEKFDATFFGVHFKYAQAMDSQTRILMEVAYEAVIDAGINPKTLKNTRTGVFVGSCATESEKMLLYEGTEGVALTGCSRSMMANRISYALDLNGPSYSLDSACSSSMYALDNAFTAFRNGEIDAAIIEPIVASMVVGEKRVGHDGNEGIIETLMNIMGLGDLSSVSLIATVPESGMNSLKAVEIKQTFDQEINFNTTLLPLITRHVNASELHTNPNIIIPGVEGASSAVWHSIAAVFDDVMSVLKPTESFYLIGYSFGCTVTLQLASLLEKAGYQGRVLLIDAAPLVVRKLILGYFKNNFEDEDLQNILLSTVITMFSDEKTVESVYEVFMTLRTYDEKLSKALEFMKKQDVHSVDYVKFFLNRLNIMATDNDLDHMDMLNASITQVRPSYSFVEDIENDYCLSGLTKGKMTMKLIEGNHISILNNPRLPQIINDFDPATKHNDMEKH